MPVPLPSLIAVVASALLGAAFVSTDSALGSLSSARVSALLEQHDIPHRPALERYQRDAAAMHSTYTVGRVVCAVVAAVLVADLIEPALPGVPGLFLSVLATVALFAPLTDFAVAVARARADSWGPRSATFLRPFELVLWPLSAPLARVTALLAEKLAEAPTAPEVASAEVEYLVDEVERSGVVGAEPAEMIRNVLEFEDLRAHDAMIPRTRVEAIDLATPLALVRKLVAESGHSRYPVYSDQLDNVVGLLCAKDVFKVSEPEGGADGEPTLSEIVRSDVIFVHEHQKLSSLLKEMRQKRQHLAVVVDEFGGTSGIVTLEDIIEEIVGDIRDEHDEAEAAPIQEIGDGRLLANASLCLADLSAYLAVEVPASSLDLSLADCFDGDTQPGASAERHGITMIAREVTGGRVKMIEIARRPETSLRPPPTTPRPADSSPRPTQAAEAGADATGRD